MEEIFDFIADLSKRLTRPIKDLDDIRFAMAALKEMRENEIRIDMSISPIEVRIPCWISDDYEIMWLYLMQGFSCYLFVVNVFFLFRFFFILTTIIWI